MEISGWMIGLGVTIAGIVSTFAVMKSNVMRVINNRKEDKKKIEELEKNLISLQFKVDTIPDVRKDFVNREIFAEVEKRLGEKLASLESSLEKIMKKLEVS